MLLPDQPTTVYLARRMASFIGFDDCLFTARFRPLVTQHRSDQFHNKHFLLSD